VIDSNTDWLALIAPELAIAVAVLEEEHVTRAAERLTCRRSRLAGIGAGQWMRALHCPGHTVGYALEGLAGGGGVGQRCEQLLAVCCHGAIGHFDLLSL
jgi:hypothetical protein